MEIYELRKDFKTHVDACKWINKQLKDLSYRVHHVDLIRQKDKCTAIVQYYPQ